MSAVVRPLSEEALTALEQSYEHDALVADLVAEVRHLREQRDRLQTRDTELVEENRRLRALTQGAPRSA